MTNGMDPAAHETLAQINTKLDVLLAQHGHVANQVTDHEGRMRALEAGHVRADARLDEIASDLSDKETRVRVLERGRWPLPSLAAVVSIGALILALLGLLNKGG